MPYMYVRPYMYALYVCVVGMLGRHCMSSCSSSAKWSAAQAMCARVHADRACWHVLMARGREGGSGERVGRERE